MTTFHRRQILAAGGAAAVSLGLPGLARAQSAVDTLRILCGFPAGGTTDAVTRRVADKLRGTYARTTLVENKAGAGGRLAVEELKRSAPDGTTMLLTPASMITVYPHIFQRLSYTSTDFTPVAAGAVIQFGFGVGPAVPDTVKTLKDYLAWAKANPDKASYATPGAGSPNHFIAALLAKESGVELNQVPYRGSAPGIQDLLGGQIPAMSSPVGDYVPHLKSGRLRLLATSGAKRSRFAPDVPTYTEQGFPSLQMQEWYGFFMPQKTPTELVNRAAAGIQAAARSQDVIDGLAQLGVQAWSNTPVELTKAVYDETRAWGPIVKKVGFTPEA